MSQQEIMNGIQNETSGNPDQSFQLLALQLEKYHSVLGSQAVLASEGRSAESSSTPAAAQQDAFSTSTANPGQNQIYAGFGEVQLAEAYAWINALHPTQDEYMDNRLFPGTDETHADVIAFTDLPPDTSADNVLEGGDGGDILLGACYDDKLFIGGAGDDFYIVSSDEEIIEDAAAGTDSVIADLNWPLGNNLENLILDGDHAPSAAGNELDNLVLGNSANNVLEPGAGGQATLYLGGQGNDTLMTGAGNDIILFNAGDGQDAVFSKGTGRKTLSLGGDFAYDNLAFSKDGNSLVLKLGTADQISFEDWYADTPSHSVVNLQVVAEAMSGFDAGGSDPLLDQKIERFDFAGLAGAFEAARTATPTLTDWALSNALSNFQQDGSDSAAIGGDLSYQYGRDGALSGIGLSAAQAISSDSRFGRQAQDLRPLSEQQGGALRMS
jgi:Ca2+-binding RTX toxin-like protein